MYNISTCLSVQFPTAVFVYIHRNQSSNHSTGNKGPIGKNKGPGRQNVHSSEFEILALYIYIIVYNITRGYSVGGGKFCGMLSIKRDKL